MVTSSSDVSHKGQQKNVLDIFARFPVTHQTEDGHFTTYAVIVETNNESFSLPKSSIHRRYSEFVRLRRMLKIHHPNIEPPKLPPKTFPCVNRFDPGFIEQRRKGLEKFLQQSVHLFLQSQLSIDRIERLVDEKAKFFDPLEKENIASTSSLPGAENNTNIQICSPPCNSDHLPEVVSETQDSPVHLQSQSSSDSSLNRIVLHNLKAVKSETCLMKIDEKPFTASCLRSGNRRPIKKSVSFCTQVAVTQIFD
ncbi:serine/threonine-protein kinase Sgk3-like isoform X2 [Limulus polyphemus]|uniref:Sorting nexin-3 n=1 Tax=Limulus polyphemus TaxID=6850 RepID=A0ABM1S2Z6_LIMPO|nr:serine/threonine-protein kinase Sgk3-like isoform X2 [Limulus polyphemus]